MKRNWLCKLVGHEMSARILNFPDDVEGVCIRRGCDYAWVKPKMSPPPPPPETIDCETCGCMVKKEKAVRGESQIRMRYTSWRLDSLGPDQEYIYTPWYCKACAPEKPKEEKQEPEGIVVNVHADTSPLENLLAVARKLKKETLKRKRKK